MIRSKLISLDDITLVKVLRVYLYLIELISIFNFENL